MCHWKMGQRISKTQLSMQIAMNYKNEHFFKVQFNVKLRSPKMLMQFIETVISWSKWESLFFLIHSLRKTQNRSCLKISLKKSRNKWYCEFEKWNSSWNCMIYPLNNWKPFFTEKITFCLNIKQKKNMMNEKKWKKIFDTKVKLIEKKKSCHRIKKWLIDFNEEKLFFLQSI